MAPSDHVRRAFVRSCTAARRYGLLLATAALGLPGCASDEVLGDYPASTCDLAEPPADAERVLVSVASFWTDDTEENSALKVLIDGMDRRLYTADTQQMRTRVDTQNHINEAFQTEQLPDVFQVNGGSDVLRWVHSRSPDTSDVCTLDKLRDTYHWDEAYFEATLAPLSCDQHLYGLPVGVHNLNVLFYNSKLFAALKQQAAERGITLTDPSQLASPQELAQELAQVASLNAVTEDRTPIVPLSLGTSMGWPLTIMAFENVLLGLGHDAYETLWMGRLEHDPDGSGARALTASLQDMLAVLREMLRYSNADQPVITWQEALGQVGTGAALFTVMGDWGWAQLTDVTAPDVATATFPGTSGVFVYTPDSFAVPRELGKSGYAARAFLHDVLENKTILRRFSNFKHSIPPRWDFIDQVDELNTETLQNTYRRFEGCSKGVDNCKLLLAVSGLGPPPGTNKCFDKVDALLTTATTGNAPPADTESTSCPTPSTSSGATSQLIELLLGIARQRFAADCR